MSDTQTKPVEWMRAAAEDIWERLPLAASLPSIEEMMRIIARHAPPGWIKVGPETVPEPTRSLDLPAEEA